MTAVFEPRQRVAWHVPVDRRSGAEVVLPAIVIQQSAKRVHIRATALNGHFLFRWVSATELREAEHVEG